LLFCAEGYYKGLILDRGAANAPFNSPQLLAALFVFSRRIRGFYRLLHRIDRSEFYMQIMVRDNNVDQALRALKKKLQREGVYREMKLRRHYEKPSEKRARDKAAAVRRARKMERKVAERDGRV
jgi:small subunit ribosomal protein S21